MAVEALAEGAQLLDLVGGHLAAFQLVTEGIEAVGGFARGVSGVEWQWCWGHRASFGIDIKSGFLSTFDRQNIPHFRHAFPALSSAFVVNIERLAILEEIGGRHEFCRALAEPEKREGFDAE